MGVEHLRSAQAVQFGELTEGEDVGQHAGHDFGDGRAAGDIDHGAAREDFVDRFGPGGIWLGGLHASVGGARTPGNNRLGVFGRFQQDIQEAVAAHGAVHAPIGSRRVALHGQQVLPLVVLHDLLADFLGLFSRRRLQRVVVVQRNHVQDDVLGDRVRAADETLTAAGAFQPVQPDHRNARFGLHGGHHLGDHGSFQPHDGCQRRAVFEEGAPIHTVLFEHRIGRR